MANSKYMNPDGTLKDRKILNDIRKAADWYEDGAIAEAQQMLSEIVEAIELFDPFCGE